MKTLEQAINLTAIKTAEARYHSEMGGGRGYTANYGQIETLAMVFEGEVDKIENEVDAITKTVSELLWKLNGNGGEQAVYAKLTELWAKWL